MSDLAGVVLCGGAGRRMGRDKATIMLGGEPLALHAARRLAEVAHPVVLARGAMPAIAGPYENIPDARPDSGPLGGIVAALRELQAPYIAVVAADMPRLNPRLLSLARELHETEDAIVPIDDVGLQPLHAVYARSALGPLEEALAAGMFAMNRVLALLDVRVVTRDEWIRADPSGRFGANVNTLPDLKDLF